MKVTRRLRDQLGTVAREAADQARERLGRGEEEQAAPAADAPGNRPRAAFAGVLDGRHLWLAVDATPGTLAVREAGTDRIVSLDTDLAEDDPRYRSVRSDLASADRWRRQVRRGHHRPGRQAAPRLDPAAGPQRARPRPRG